MLFKLWRDTLAWRKLEMMDSLNRDARRLALTGLRRRYPDAAPAELRWRLADIVPADQVYGPLTA